MPWHREFHRLLSNNCELSLISRAKKCLSSLCNNDDDDDTDEDNDDNYDEDDDDIYNNTRWGRPR